MKLFGLVVILFVGWGSYRLMTVLSADAMAMAVGIMFGILAGVPTTLLALASNRRHDAPQAGTAAREPVERRYTVITGNSSAYVLDNATGATYAIVQPEYKQVIEVVK